MSGRMEKVEGVGKGGMSGWEIGGVEEGIFASRGRLVLGWVRCG